MPLMPLEMSLILAVMVELLGIVQLIVLMVNVTVKVSCSAAEVVDM